MMPQRRIPPITWTIFCILILALGVTSYAKTADIILVSVRLATLVVFSILAVREWWNYHHRSQWSNTQPDAAGDLLRRIRRWLTDDHDSVRKS